MNTTNSGNQNEWAKLFPFARPSSKPIVIIMMGLSGSGKTSVSQFLANHFKAVWVSSDIERQKLFKGHKDIYSQAANRQVFAHMGALAKQLIKAGYPVILDSCALKKSERDQFRQIAKDTGCCCRLIHCRASPNVLKHRINHRLMTENNASEATLDLVNSQQYWLESPEVSEQQQLITLDTTQKDWSDFLIKSFHDLY